MKNRNHLAWTRLVAVARRAPVSADLTDEISAPSGFATRVVAHAGLRAVSSGGGLLGAGFDRLAARALGLACACAITVAVWGSLSATAEARSTDTTTTDGYIDPVGDYLTAVQSS